MKTRVGGGRVLPWVWAASWTWLLSSGCNSSSGGGSDSEPSAGTAVVRARVDAAVMELTADASSLGEVDPEDFALFAPEIRYDEEARALVMDLVIVNESDQRFREPVILTFESLLPGGVTVLNPDNDEMGPGASIQFVFANRDGVWAPGEESLPRETRLGAPEGTSIGFVARVDAGLDSDLGAIGGLVWEDEDGDGTMDDDERGLRDVTIELSSSRFDTIATKTDDDGTYRFDDNLESGLYEVRKILSGPLVSTTSTVIDVVLVESDGQVSSFLAANFGCRRVEDEFLGVIGGIVWNDANENGEIDRREEGIVGARLALTGGRIRDRFARTDRAGAYHFDGLEAGTYTVTKLPLEDFSPTTPTTIRVTLVETDRGVDRFLEVDFGCVERDADEGDDEDVCLCHKPPGNPSNAHTICVGAPAVRVHLMHGDSLGPCGARERICDDDRDNDGDRLVDCLDPDCFDSSACDGDREEICDDYVDNDGDRLVDCQDPECTGQPGPRSETCQLEETICDDGRDNDGDGDLDCDDPSCFVSLECNGPEPEICDDGIDNDSDRLVDCRDPECTGQLGSRGQVCELRETICADELDNDGDGRVDCDDRDCALSSECD